MIISDACIIDEPGLVIYPFSLLSKMIADKFVATIIDGEYCEVYLSKTNSKSWKVIGVIHSKGNQIDKNELEKLILKHPKVRLPLLVS